MKKHLYYYPHRYDEIPDDLNNNLNNLENKINKLNPDHYKINNDRQFPIYIYDIF